MLSVHNLYKNHGVEQILTDISFNISAGERIGLIGPNGSGKTTLLRILAGLDRPDSGAVTSTRPNLRTGYLAQGMQFDERWTLQSALNLNAASAEELDSRISALATELTSDPHNSELQAQYDLALEELSSVGRPASSILVPLGLANLSPDTPIAHLSGGQKTRLMLARVILEEPQLLLLDEPTNHLDIEMLEWLETWLRGFSGAALIVSHDRAFLDNTVSSILDLDPFTHSLRAYPGNYSDYLEQMLTERENQKRAYEDQQQEIAQLRAAAAHIRGLTKMRKGGKADPKNTDGFSVRFFGNRATKRTAGRAKHIDARVEKILAEEKIERPRSAWEMKLDFGAPTHYSRDVLVTQALCVGYLQPLLRDLNLHIRAGQRIVLTGSNGSGKTTLLRTIAGQLQPLSGDLKLGATVKVGVMTQEQELLDPDSSALQTIQNAAPFNETEARNFLHYFLFEDDDPLRPAHKLSFGERARLQLGLLVAQRCNFLLLDEPINHLDIPSRSRFEDALSRFKGTILAVVHDRYFIERFASEVWALEAGRVRKR